MNTEPSPQDQEKTVQALFEVMRDLIVELHPSKTRTLMLNLDSSLDDDLGLDSLARVELISRVERHFDIVLSQRVFVEVESVRDLLRAITTAQGRIKEYKPVEVTRLVEEKVENLPYEATTLIEMLEWHVNKHPDRLHIRILDDEGEDSVLTYKQLWDGAKKVAAGLQQHSVQPGDTVAIMLPTSKDYFYSFYAVLLIGAIPVPIYPPVRRSQLEEHLRRHSGILKNCAATTLITISEAKLVAKLLKSQVESIRAVETVAELSADVAEYGAPSITQYDIAFLQYTSGSTGNPKGVVLTHANLLANIRAMGEAVKANSSDVFVSWLPLYHDMGLIGAWLGSLYYAVTFVVMSPLSFLMRPQRWLEAIHRYHGTLSASPNFGYELCLKRITDEDIKDLNLSSWRIAFNGAEPVSPETIERFSARFRTAGFKPNAMMPVYGLAESAVGLAFPPVEREPIIDCVDREQFTRTGHAVTSKRDDKNALCFVSCGLPLAQHQVRIVDANGRELAERQEGYLQFRGPSVTSGYYRNPEATKKLFYDEWLDSGDVAYMAQGEIFLTGRSKDVIIRAGRNIYPHELEEAVGNIPGIRKGCVAAFGSTDPRSRTEQLVVLAEIRETVKDKDALYNKITALANDLIGTPPDEVVLAPPHTVLKTSSGKIRRSACRALYEQGLLGQVQKAVWIQIAHTILQSLLPALRRFKQQVSSHLFAGYAWTVFGVLAALAWAFILLLPNLSLRWLIIHSMSKLLAVMTGTKLEISGLDNLPPETQHCIYVANHASYLDAFAIIAAIPRAVSFVAKVELQRKSMLRLSLGRLRVEFVERFDKEKGMIDTKRIINAAKRKQSLFFFAEGTFTRVPGLQKFFMGAFMTAAQAKLPVVPIAISGTRSMLRAGSWFPRRGRITVTVGRAISIDELKEAEKGDLWQIALKLKDAARKHILRYCGEPDLAP